jgi:hypothetical protein
LTKLFRQPPSRGRPHPWLAVEKPFHFLYAGWPMERALTHLHLEAGPAGWVKALWRRGARSREHTCYVRFQKKGGWWRSVELHATAATQDHLRDIPLHKIELAVNANSVVTETLERWLNRKSPVDFDGAFGAALKRVPRTSLKPPTSRKLDDDFYREVAFAYRDAVRRGLNPGKTIAADTKKPASTVNRWIGETRQRGYLPPAEPGKVSA